MTVRRVIVHGHFYQPPREDPWLEEIPLQKGAAPWHDWNEKIERECYRAVVAARVVDSDGRIARVMNTLARMSFDIGPTLFEWMERYALQTYEAILHADRLSVQRTGYGNAIAQPYHHVILPLASRRDKVTEVRWGIADFQRRFGRAPEGMWLPETAVDDETLDVLAQEGIRFTILAPHQVTAPPPNGMPGTYTTASGRSIALFAYDGALSHGVAFGRLLSSAGAWKQEILRAFDVQRPEGIVSIATDGETYGHHHHFSEMALAHLLDDFEQEDDGIEITNYASVLAGAHMPEYPLDLVEPSSWSCTHGVERWRSNCGCRIDTVNPPRQEWRGPLREGLETLRLALDAQFAKEGADLFMDPDVALDRYGAVVGADPGMRDTFVATQMRPGLTLEQQIRARELLEMARDGLRMFTSCAWFFDDLTGLEPAQNLRYAARAIELSGDNAPALEKELLVHLRRSHSSEPASLTAEEVWMREVKPSIDPAVRLAAGAASVHVVAPEASWSHSSAYDIDVEKLEKHGTHETATGSLLVTMVNRRTGTTREFSVSVRVNDTIPDIICYVRPLNTNDELVGTIPVALADFSENERRIVLEALRLPRRRELARRLLGPEMLERVACGDISFADAGAAALAVVISAIAEDPSEERIERVGELLDLIALVDRKIPFDVQTAFARALTHVAPAHRGVLAPLAARLGFAPSILADTVEFVAVETTS